jgi:uncharacterized protein YbgA (DUF1722 family)
VECGLGVPREPIRVVMEGGARRLYQPATERDVTDEMVRFVSGFLDGLPDIDGFILKNRSPSCGFNDVKIFASKKPSAQSSRGAGFFGDQVVSRFGRLAIEDEGRLNNFLLREHFLTQLFALARFREIRQSNNINRLMEFHASYKYLLMAYHQAEMRKMGPIVANHEKHPPEVVFDKYAVHFSAALSKPVKVGPMINAIQHGFGGVSDQLSFDEKHFFLVKIEEYRDERIPRSILLNLVQAWGIRFKADYLLKQALFQPFPLELMEVTDSGKGRSLQ